MARKTTKKPVEIENIASELENIVSEIENRVEDTFIEEEVKQEVKPKKVESKQKAEPKVKFVIGDKVTINKDVNKDAMAKSINSGLKNKQYTVVAVRPDKFVAIRCLMNTFTLHESKIEKVK